MKSIYKILYSLVGGCDFGPPMIGAILIASGAANLHYLADNLEDGPLSFLVQIEVELLAGVWLIAGLSPRWTRMLGILLSVSLLIYDFKLLSAGQPPRSAFGRTQTTSWMNMSGDVISGLLLLCYNPFGKSSDRLDSRPGRVLLIAVVSVVAGVFLDREQIGKYPAIGISLSRDPGRSIPLRYLVYLPAGYHYSLRDWPLVIFLHGAGTVGHDLDKLRLEGLARFAEKKTDLSFVLVAPQAPTYGWSPTAIDSLLDQILARYRADPDRVFLTGLSMGGYGTWSTASAFPGRYAAIAPICGGGDPAEAASLRDLPIWVFHGAKDQVVPLEKSREMVDALKMAGSDVKFTIYSDAAHDSWTETYANPCFYTWLLKQKRRGTP